MCEHAHAVVTSSGTSALHVCLLLAGVQQGDEVLVPTLTFVAAANAVAYCGATALRRFETESSASMHRSSIATCEMLPA